MPKPNTYVQLLQAQKAIKQLQHDNAVIKGFTVQQCLDTVTKTSPLEITIDTAMAPLKSSVLYLTESVVEKKIPVVAHNHMVIRRPQWR